MPLHMDIHRGLAELTAQDVARARHRDPRVQEKHGVEFLRHWFNKEDGSVFCLSESPSKEAAEAVHLRRMASPRTRSSRSGRASSNPLLAMFLKDVEPRMMPEGNKAIIRRLVELLNEGKVDAVDQVFAPDYVRHDPSDLLHEVGVEGYKAAFTKLRSAFPDAHWTIEELLEDGDKVIARASFRGTHTGPLFNIPPTREVVTYPIMGIYRIENSRIAEDWHIFHALGLWKTVMPDIARLIAEAQR